jgi:S-adenosylmethionine decarboxylase
MSATHYQETMDHSSRAAPPPAAVNFKATNGHLPAQTEEQLKGYFITRDGKTFAGAHLIIDLRNAKRLDDVVFIEETLIEAAKAAGATLLHTHCHHFSGGGVSGVAVLSESHISIHTWPEHGFAALDVFMCGCCDPKDTIPVLKRAFEPEQIDVQEILRGEARA